MLCLLLILSGFCLDSLEAHFFSRKEVCVSFDDGVDFTGHDVILNGSQYIIRNVPSPSLCQLECQKVKECQFWSYSKDSVPDPNARHFCYLKTSMDGIQYNDHIISGSKISLCPKCYTIRPPDRPNNTIKGIPELVPRSITLEKCKELCKVKKCDHFWYYAGPFELSINKTCDIHNKPTQRTSGEYNRDYVLFRGSCFVTNFTVPMIAAGIIVVLTILFGVCLFIWKFKRNKPNKTDIHIPMELPSIQDSTLEEAIQPTLEPVLKIKTPKEFDLSLEKFMILYKSGEIPKWKEFTKLRHTESERFKKLHSNVGALHNLEEKGEMNSSYDSLPFDHNRVVLKQKINQTDYINASWVSGLLESQPKFKFIVTQLPLYQTIQHFLTMVDDNGVDTVVTLGKIENSYTNSSRFHKFWPDVRQSVRSSTHSICTKSETCIQDHATLIKRICQLDRHGYTHSFTQFQCTVNNLDEVDPNDMVWLARTIFHMICYKTPMIVIQTTDGQGLTGVLVALLKVLEEIELGKVNVVNVYETVLALGQYKQNMIKDERHYRLLYSCVHKMIIRDGH